LSIVKTFTNRYSVLKIMAELGMLGVVAQLGVYCLQIYGFSRDAIEDAKGLGRDLTSSRLTLDILKERLDRWKAAATLNGRGAELSIQALAEIIILLEEANKLQDQYENSSKTTSSNSLATTLPGMTAGAATNPGNTPHSIVQTLPASNGRNNQGTQSNASSNPVLDLETAVSQWKTRIKDIQAKTGSKNKVIWSLTGKQRLMTLLEDIEKKAQRLNGLLSEVQATLAPASKLSLGLFGENSVLITQ
jgi:hypothetical protein